MDREEVLGILAKALPDYEICCGLVTSDEWNPSNPLDRGVIIDQFEKMIVYQMPMDLVCEEGVAEIKVRDPNEEIDSRVLKGKI